MIVADCLDAARKLRRAVAGSIVVRIVFGVRGFGRKDLVRRKIEAVEKLM